MAHGPLPIRPNGSGLDKFPLFKGTPIKRVHRSDTQLLADRVTPITTRRSKKPYMGGGNSDGRARPRGSRSGAQLLHSIFHVSIRTALLLRCRRLRSAATGKVRFVNFLLLRQVSSKRGIDNSRVDCVIGSSRRRTLLAFAAGPPSLKPLSFKCAPTYSRGGPAGCMGVMLTRTSLSSGPDVTRLVRRPPAWPRLRAHNAIFSLRIQVVYMESSLYPVL